MVCLYATLGFKHVSFEIRQDETNMTSLIIKMSYFINNIVLHVQRTGIVKFYERIIIDTTRQVALTYNNIQPQDLCKPML